MSFSLSLTDQFLLPDGHTILTGVIAGHPSMIGQTVADVFIDGQHHCRIEVEGEWLTEKRIRREQRAISTLAKIDLPADWKQRGVRIVEK